MPIQFPDFQRISFDEANPMLVGAERGFNLGKNMIQFPQDLQAKILANQIQQVKAKYAEPMAGQELTKAIQENQWNPKIWQSEIGLRGAQAGKLGKETQWYDKEAAARIGLQQSQARGQISEAQINELKYNEMKKALGGLGAGSGTGGGSGSVAPGAGGADQSGSMPSSQGAPSQPSLYGIPTPQPSHDDLVNKMVYGIDSYSDRQKQAYEQQQQQKKLFMDQIGESQKNATAGQKAAQALSIFNDAMDKTSLSGPYWGTTPSSGWRTLYHGANDVAQAQVADNAVANLLPGAMAEIKDAMGSGKFSIIDMQASQKIKVDRAMDKPARQNASNFMNGVITRMDEQAKFYQTLANPMAGVDKSTADLLWQNYQNEFPLYDKDSQSYKQDNLHNWPLYTTPKAIASVKATGTYTPTRAEKNTFMMMVPDKSGQFHVMPVKSGDVEKVFRNGGRPL